MGSHVNWGRAGPVYATKIRNIKLKKRHLERRHKLLLFYDYGNVQ